ncbi:ABC transporter substrate-binding protein [Moorena producens PAL-8-15-08-1]|uniref:ABC transporter substrate-binding protein n=1 Tax=Moorena producens PAL-8-15-08-1 TaxID=1458985 RepID=A0A1D8TM70_9CYAN|nr:ABC transporter permease [Moorena producens]AOW98751.1 ABC transporter substrate-binding protein [Moorena producens PAL-8-15-08-1]
MATPVQIRFSTASTVEVLVMALEALWSNRLRTGLTMLGVIIGIASVIAITSLGQGVQKATEQQLQGLGTNVMLVFPDTPRNSRINLGSTGRGTRLNWEDARAIKEQVTTASAVSAFLQKPNVSVVYGGKNILTTVIGTDLSYPEVKNIYPQSGQFFNQDDLLSSKSVVVLGSKLREQLFEPGANAIGANIRIQGERYIVIGVMESKGAVGRIDQDNQIYIPLTTMSARLIGNNALAGIAINGLWLKASDESSLSAAQFQVTNLLRLRHNIYPPQADNFRIINQTDMINTLNNVVGLFTVMVGAVAGISLVVGGIGIANIMLASVVERRREIGIRKALGATKSAILKQFLAEAVVVSGVGGVIGMGFGIALAFSAATILQFPFVLSLWSVISSFGLSCIVGLLAGVIPANNAAKLDPIVALRTD